MHDATPTDPTLTTAAARRVRWRIDLAVVVLLTWGCYALSSALELNEWMSHTLARYERWQADELPLSLTVLAATLAWFALRRRREAQAELQLREQAEARVTGLLRHNRELAQRLIGLQESEGRALARDLHDEVGQACSAIRVELALIRHCEGAAREGIAEAAERAEGRALRLYTLVHDVLSGLRPANLETLGLVAALQELCESWEERGDENNLDAHGKVPGYGVLNLDTERELGKGFEVFARINNLFNRKYANFGILGENVFANAADRFDPANATSETFLGLGAPPGVWVGVRYEWD